MIKINLLPAEIIAEKNNEWKRIIPFVILWVVLAICFGIGSAKIWEIRLLEQEIFEVDSHLDANRELVPELKSWEKEKQLLQKNKSVQSSILAEKIPTSFMLDQLTIMLPEDMWFTSILLHGKELEIKGATLSYKSLAVFLSNLNASKYFSQDPVLLDSGIIDLTDNEELESETKTKQSSAISFTIKGNLTDKEVASIESQITIKSQPQ